MAVTAMVAISFGQQATSAELTFETPREQAIAIDAPSTTGLEKVYVLATAEGVRAKFTADSPAAAMTVRWKRFGMLGGGYAEDVASSVSGRESYIDPRSHIDYFHTFLFGKATDVVIRPEGNHHALQHLP